ncbi:MAG: AraC family transcriptional regulator [Chitinophagaceae bacterium]
MQLSPSPALAGIIRHFLLLENNSSECKRFRLFPDGSPGMVFTLKGCLKGASLYSDTFPESFIYGQLTQYLDIYAEANTRLMIVPFHPASFSSLLGIPAVSLADQITEMNMITGNDLRIELQSLQETSTEKNVKMIEALVMKKCLENVPGKLQVADRALQVIRQHKGGISVKELCSVTGCHQRNLERLFREFVGLSPKRLCTIHRVHNFIRETRTDRSSARFTSGALSSGYFDQAHLNHEFKSLTGITPGDYFRNGERLAVNFFSV